jgi:holo-[acyl-carrier protein] synthase
LSAEPGLSGVEVGLVSVPRFRRALDRFGPRLLHRIFSADEIAYAARKRDGAHNLAARFAAKCAGRRALARLGARPGRWLEIEVVRRRSGEPTLKVHCAEEAAVGTDGLRFTLSLTHDPDLAMASVFVWGEGSS